LTIGTHSSRIAVATSFPPKLKRMNAGRPMDDYDRLCVQSWIASGFRVIGVNASEEIPQLATRYEGVEFVAVERTAQAMFGRNTPFIADMASILAAQPEPVLGIVNSDLLFEPVPAWQNLEAFVAQKMLVTGQRLDVKTLAGGALHQYFPGFDYFFFGSEAAAVLAKSPHPFSMGLPWWDYWCPLSLAARGYELRSLEIPAVLHLAHESAVGPRNAIWRRLAVEFARSMMRETARHARPGWNRLIALCRSLEKATDTEIENGERDNDIAGLCEICVPMIQGTAMRLDDTQPSASSAPGANFEDVANRVAAGRALHQAMWEEQQGRWDAANALFATASQNAPQDPGVLSAYGNYLFRRGDMKGAAILLGRAVELLPDSAMLLNSLGAALGQLGRDAAAAACFERALQADPHDGASYYNLTMCLYPSGRHLEIIARLERVLRDAPDFTDGPLWLQRILEKLPRNG
jgi:hypothetical protein